MDWERRVAELERELANRDQLIAELREALAAKDARLAEQDARLAEIERTQATLTERLGQNSSNSNKPPSGDGPEGRAKRKKRRKAKGQRKRGAQPSHRGARRELLAADQVDDVIDFFPLHCEECDEALPKTPDPDAKRYQVTELPAFEPHTTEYRRHTVVCPCCRHKTRAPYDSSIPASPFGPRLMSAIAMLTGVYHISRRKTVDLLSDLLGVRISLGAVSSIEARVSDALEQPVHDTWKRVWRARVKHTDGTTWYQSGIALSLWTLATAFATVFKIVANGRSATLKPLFGSLHGTLVSDRATALGFWAMERRQICWAHLLRKFVSFSERDGPAGSIGRELLEYTGILFQYWHDLRDGTLDRETFRMWMAPLRSQFETLLNRAVAAELESVSGSCADILAHRAALWTFIDRADVEPTNNHAERELRAFVLWRKRSFGSQSERGNRFAERLMTIAHTARKQNKNVLEFITACCVVRMDGGRAPSLFEPERAV